MTKKKLKKTVKKKTTKKVSAKKSEMVTSGLVKKLKASKMPKTVIAKALGYKSHNTVKRWFDTGKLPVLKLAAVKTLLRKGV